MQSLDIVPENGPRSIRNGAFALIGESALKISHIQAWLKNDRIKGFALVWPAGDEERRSRLLDEMHESLTRIAGVMDPGAGSGREQKTGLVSGLEIRKRELSRSGFFVDERAAW